MAQTSGGDDHGRQPRDYGPILRVRLPYEMKVALDEAVKQRNSTRSALIHEMLAVYLGLDQRGR